MAEPTRPGRLHQSSGDRSPLPVDTLSFQAQLALLPHSDLPPRGSLPPWTAFSNTALLPNTARRANRQPPDLPGGTGPLTAPATPGCLGSSMKTCRVPACFSQDISHTRPP